MAIELRKLKLLSTRLIVYQTAINSYETGMNQLLSVD